MVRIGGSTPEGRHIHENDYYTKNGEFRIDKEGSATMLNCLMYKLCYHRFGAVHTEHGRPTGYDRVRHAEIGNKNFDLRHLEEAYTSEHWIVRVFRVLKPVIELFCQLLFSHPHTANSILADVHARLGLSFKSVDNISLALKHLTIAFEDGQEESAFPKHFLRFQIAHCFDISGDVRKAVEEYRKLIDDSAVAKFGNQLLAAIYCRLGWISLCAREREPQEHQYQKLKDAEKLLCKAREFSPTDSKANCYLGLCYSEQRRELAKKVEEEPQNTPNGQQQHIHQPRYNADQAAQNAFVSYRTAIDSDESDANIWRSIGVLYQQQNQPIDALQAFACAVQLNDRHFGAWLDLGHLYENHRQYAEALAAYIKALQASTEPPEQLRTRIFAIEHELSQIGGPKNYSLLLHQQHQTNRRSDLILLPTIENAWQLGIPAQVRQRLADLKNHTVLNYREGSPLWSMQELIADSMQMDSPITSNKLTPTQRQILQILKINKDQFEGGSLETTLLHELEQRVPSPSPADDGPKNGERNATSPTGGPMAETAAVSQRLKRLESPSAFSKCDRRPSPSTLAFPTAASSSSLQQELPLPSSMMSPKEEVPMEEDEENESPSTSHQYHRHHKHQIQEEKISSSTSFSSDLPPNFSLLAPVHVPVTVSSEEIFDLCKKRVAKPDEYFLAPIFDEDVPPPRKPIPSQTPMLKDKLLLKTPLVLVENQKDASAIELQQYCYNQPIVLIHGLTMALKIDLSQFSTKTLIQTAPEHEVEVRTQYKMPSYDVNLDQMGEPTWAIRSSKSWSTISRYGQYQAESFRHSLKEETEKLRQANPKLFQQQTPTTSEVPIADNVSPVPSKKRKATAATAASMAAGSGTPTGRGRVEESSGPYKIIKFGTNIDLSDERKFYAQLKELNKLPAFCRLHSASNMLSYLGHTVYGMNTVQLYLKVPGCRTPGHLENNSFASINVNIGPGECEWFGVPYEYWPGLENMCKDRSIDFLRGAWWPGVTDLIKADVPFYRFTQKAGDVVWVNGGCVHWVQSTGWCNNVAWNVGPMTANQLEMALQAHEWNRLNSYQSLVPMQHLCWSLARDVRFTNQKLFNLVKHMLIRSLAYCQMLVDYVAVALKSPIKKQQRQKGECAHYCHLCEVEVFNILFVKEIGGKWKIFCVQCARRSQCFNDHVVLQQYSFEELSSIFDRFQLYPAKPTLIC
uniref:JmjC domain-containing protein n=1 Tax=Globodera pallida TaxID=36090 RepID=A0A183CGM8_GLOPA